MDKELCLKFLVHLHRFASTVARKDHINEVDITYINNEVANFLSRLDPKAAAVYDKAGALQAVARIPEESAADKAFMISKHILKAKARWLPLLGAQKDEAHEHRKAKVEEFREKVRKVIALLEYA